MTPFPFLEIPPQSRAKLLAPTTAECHKSGFPTVEGGDKMKAGARGFSPSALWGKGPLSLAQHIPLPGTAGAQDLRSR